MARKSTAAQPAANPADAVAAAEPAIVVVVTEPQAAVYPASIELVTPYGFYDDNDTLKMWQPGQVVSDPDEVKLLVDRGAEIKVLE